MAEEHAPSIVFIDEIDAVGTKRYESNSGGEREIQRTMLELLNQLDGFDSRGDVKVRQPDSIIRYEIDRECKLSLCLNRDKSCALSNAMSATLTFSLFATT